MIGRGAKVTFPPVLGLVSSVLDSIGLVDDPLPGEHAGLDAAGLGNPAQLLDALRGQTQSVHRAGSTGSATVGQLDVAGGLGMLGFGRDPVEQLSIGTGHHDSSSSAE